jgi:DegV family protein with EDD domain
MSIPSVRIVVDSTADIPPALAAELGIIVVPLTVRFGTEVFRDGVEITPAQFMQRLTTSTEMPTTAQPPPGEFTAAYRPLIEGGASVISLHISADLSGTYNSASLAAREISEGGGRIDVVDTRTATMAHGLLAIEAARAARAGADHEAVLAGIRDQMQRVHLVVLLDTLEFLQRGGRIGRARAAIGSLLSIKPLITVADGVVTPLEQVRTRQKAITRVVERARALADREVTRLAVLYTADAASGEGLATSLSTLVPREQMIVTEAGPVIATYVGPGALAFAALTAR